MNENLIDEGWRVKVLEIPNLTNLLPINQIKVQSKKLDDLSAIIPNFDSAIKDYQNKIPNDALDQFYIELLQFSERSFPLFKRKNPEFVKETKKVQIDMIAFTNRKLEFPDALGIHVSNHLKINDFDGCFWFTLQILQKSLKSFLYSDQRTLNKFWSDYECIKRLKNLRSLSTLLKVLVISSFRHSFAFSYSFISIYHWLLMLNTLKFDQKAIELAQFRLCLLERELLLPLLTNSTITKRNWYEAEDAIVSILCIVFPQIKLGQNYFLAWGRLLKANIQTFCQVNYPHQPDSFFQKDMEETKKHLNDILSTMEDKLFGFSVGISSDVAINLPDFSLGFNISFIQDATKSYKGVLCLLSAGFHEFAHEKGYLSYKQGNYFQVSPERLKFEAGNFVQISAFNGQHNPTQMHNHEIIYQIRLKLILSLPYCLAESIKVLLDPSTLKKDSEEFQNYSSTLASSLNQQSDSQMICCYSSIRNSFLKGWADLSSKN